jgi:hypothetical protein
MARSLLRRVRAVATGRPRPTGALLRYAMVLGVAAVALAGFLLIDQSARAQGETTIVLKTTVTAADTGRYKYLPFTMPRGVNRVSVELTKTVVPGTPTDPGGPPTSGTPGSPAAANSVTGLGIFDERGPEYGSAGFRGIYGEEDQDFFIANDTASVSFTPGPINPGEWTVIVPVFRGAADEITVTVKLATGDKKPTPAPEEDIEMVSDTPGWYRGDLHDHTTHSSDAGNSNSARTPAEFPDEVRNAGLDYVSLTDHNVTSQNRNLGTAAAGKDVLVMPGLEMTNWFHGHATVTGLEPGDWLDWRQRPRPAPTFENEDRIDRFIADTEREGRDVFTSAAHPSIVATIDWEFFQEAEVNPDLLPDALEVWTGPFQPDDEATLERWDEFLKRSITDKRFRIVANGASDIHGFDNDDGFKLGKPTTVVHADALSKPAVVDALEAGRSFISKSPTGPELYLSATAGEGAPGEQRQIVGGTIYGDPATRAKVSVLVRGGSGRRLELLRDGERFQTTPITSDEQTVTVEQPVGTGGFVRAELRGSPRTDPNPRASELDMEALTNPIFLERGAVPPGTAPDPTLPPSGGGSAGAGAGSPESRADGDGGSSGSNGRGGEEDSSDSGADGAATPPPPGPRVLGTTAAKRRLRLSVRPARFAAGKRARFRFRAFVATGARPRGRGTTIRPVAGATVRFAGARLRTDRRGYATLLAHVRRPGVVRARASRAGFKPGSARVRALRRR